mgnify:CR=1 FL=1
MNHDTPTSCRAFSSEAVTTWFIDLILSWMGYNHVNAAYLIYVYIYISILFACHILFSLYLPILTHLEQNARFICMSNLYCVSGIEINWNLKINESRKAAFTSSANERLGVRIPAATDQSYKNSSDSSTAKRSGIGVSVTGPRRWQL